MSLKRNFNYYLDNYRCVKTYYGCARKHHKLCNYNLKKR